MSVRHNINCPTDPNLHSQLQSNSRSLIGDSGRCFCFPRWGNYIIFSPPRTDFIAKVSHCAMNDNKINEIERSAYSGHDPPPPHAFQFHPENSPFCGLETERVKHGKSVNKQEAKSLAKS